MRVSIDFYMDKDEDGVDGSVNLTRDSVDDLYNLLSLLSDATRAAGYTYVNSLGAEKDDGTVVWSDF